MLRKDSHSPDVRVALFRNQQVSGSSPLAGSNRLNDLQGSSAIGDCGYVGTMWAIYHPERPRPTPPLRRLGGRCLSSGRVRPLLAFSSAGLRTDVPARRRGFPWEASFALTHGESDFLRGRVEERCAGTLLAWLVRNGSDSPAKDVWDDPDALRAPDGVREVLDLARRFSLHVEGTPLLYNLVVATPPRPSPGPRAAVPSTSSPRDSPSGPTGRPTKTARSSQRRSGNWSSGAVDAFRIRNASSSRAGRGGSLNWVPTGSTTAIGCGRWSPNASCGSSAHGRGWPTRTA